MGRLSSGAKAGAIAGAIYGALEGAYIYQLLLSMRGPILKVIREAMPPNTAVYITPESAYQMALISGVITTIVLGLVAGIIMGALYGVAGSRLPAGTAVKGVIWGVVLWLLAILFLAPKTPAALTSEQYMMSIGLSLLFSIVYGLTMAPLYSRFQRRG